MNTSEKAEPIASIRNIERFSKSGIPIYNFEVLDTAGRKKKKKKNTGTCKALCVSRKRKNPVETKHLLDAKVCEQQQKLRLMVSF